MTSVWFENATPALDPDDPAVLTDRTWDVLVIGAGIVGLLCALRARQHGLDVCVVDSDRVGEGTTAHATVKVTSGHGALLAEIAERHGSAAATAYQRANDSGFARLSAVVAALPESVGWTTCPHLVHASRAESVAQLRATEELARHAGSDVAPCLPPPWANGEAWLWGQSALVQPLSLARALGRALQAIGVPVVERARVVAVRDGDPHPRARLHGGSEIRARDILVASHSPIHDPDGHAIRAEVFRHAAIAVTAPHVDVPSSYDVDGMSTRPVLLPDGSHGAVIVGSRRRAGVMAPDAWTTLHEWSMSALDAGEVVHRWGAQDIRSLDRLPYVGRTRRSPHILVVTGLNGWGFTNAAAIADVLPRVLESDLSYRPDGVHAPRWQADRVYPSGGLQDTAATIGWVARSVVVDHVRSMSSPEGDALRPGEGRVVGGPLSPRAECVTADGEPHRVSARCTHAGCLVRWNAAEVSWDCPCHGSRFAPDGRVLEGPAHDPLAPL